MNPLLAIGFVDIFHVLRASFQPDGVLLMTLPSLLAKSTVNAFELTTHIRMKTDIAVRQSFYFQNMPAITFVSFCAFYGGFTVGRDNAPEGRTASGIRDPAEETKDGA